jgi:4-hydroxy-tetrahydrodipicolinate reductase
MGRALTTRILNNPDFRLVGGSLRPDHPDLEKDLGQVLGLGTKGVLATADLAVALKEAKVLVDFTTPSALEGHLLAAEKAGVAVVVGTTGLGDLERAALKRAAKTIPVLWGPNMSLGVNLLYKLVDLATRSLGSDFDLEIVEAHHKGKKDAPSGTALELAKILTSLRGLDAEKDLTFGRSGQLGPRSAREVGVLALRGGDVVGEHTVYFCGLGERLELTHRAQSRETFVSGALRAALWLADKPQGFYSIKDVLGV